jgi:hypothetical protein
MTQVGAFDLVILNAFDQRMARNGANASLWSVFTGTVIGLIRRATYFSCCVTSWERAGMSG